MVLRNGGPPGPPQAETGKGEYHPSETPCNQGPACGTEPSVASAKNIAGVVLIVRAEFKKAGVLFGLIEGEMGKEHEHRFIS